MAQFQAAYDATVAAYRQTVLSSFQQVEDALARNGFCRKSHRLSIRR